MLLQFAVDWSNWCLPGLVCHCHNINPYPSKGLKACSLRLPGFRLGSSVPTLAGSCIRCWHSLDYLPKHADLDFWDGMHAWTLGASVMRGVGTWRSTSLLSIDAFSLISLTSSLQLSARSVPEQQINIAYICCSHHSRCSCANKSKNRSCQIVWKAHVASCAQIILYLILSPIQRKFVCWVPLDTYSPQWVCILNPTQAS